ncbi:MAG: glycosyltransferase [Thiotrichales bacterium]
MHFLYISDCFFPRVNGVSTSIDTFRKRLQAFGHRVSLVAPDYLDPGADDADIHRVKAGKVWLDPEDRLMRAAALRSTLDGIEAVDLVHVQTPFMAHRVGVRFARIRGIPVVATYHTFFEEYLYNYIPGLPRNLLRLAARSFSRRQCAELDALIVPSTPMLDVLRGYGITTPATVLPTGLNMDDFTSGNGPAFRHAQGIAENRPVIVYVGRVAFEKNIEFLLDVTLAVRRTLPDVLLLIAGEGTAVPHLRHAAHARGLTDHVRFVGYLRRDGELQGCYKAADVFVFASKTETQGLVLLEAMACGTPVVSTAHLGTREVLAGCDGALIASDDCHEFAQQALAVLQAPALRAQLSAGALRHAAAWSDATLAERLAAYYREVIAAHGQPGDHLAQATPRA